MFIFTKNNLLDRLNQNNISSKGKKLKFTLLSFLFIFITHFTFDFIDLVFINDDSSNISLIEGIEIEHNDQENETSESEDEVDEVDDFYDFSVYNLELNDLSTLLHYSKKKYFPSYILEIDCPPPVI